MPCLRTPDLPAGPLRFLAPRSRDAWRCDVVIIITSSRTLAYQRLYYGQRQWYLHAASWLKQFLYRINNCINKCKILSYRAALYIRHRWCIYFYVTEICLRAHNDRRNKTGSHFPKTMRTYMPLLITYWIL